MVQSADYIPKSEADIIKKSKAQSTREGTTTLRHEKRFKNALTENASRPWGVPFHRTCQPCSVAAAPPRLSTGLGSMAPIGVQLQIDDHHVVIDNGILQITLSNPEGIVTGVRYNSLDNVLEVLDNENQRGYWDVVWSALDGSGKTGIFEVIRATSFKVIVESEELVEVSFSRPWDPSLKGKFVPLNIDKRFILLRGCSGFYTYAIYEHLGSQDSQAFSLGETRVFVGAHYAGDDLIPKFGQGEPWKKVFGPVFIYLNTVAGEEDPLTLWDDAKRQMMVEVSSWPYSFPSSEDFPKSNQRGNVYGKLLVHDRFVHDHDMPTNGAYVGLATPGEAGSWQRECKDYQFWTETCENGDFSIKNIRTGTYNLYAWVPGFLGDYRNEVAITITPGCNINVGTLIYEPPRNGPTLWEIGIPDRSAAEFYVPDPNPQYVNKLFLDQPKNKFRQYGLWEKYGELYPQEDLVFTVGESDYSKDWFYAQVPRKKEDKSYEGTTWQIKFKLENIQRSATYILRIALAGASLAELQVRANDRNKPRPLFTTGLIGRDNAIPRHGIHGLYWLYSIDVLGSLLLEGDNTFYLTQTRSQSPFQAIMYDYIRLEGPNPKALV
ncbi:Carbohydrate-binding-like fold [Artemisia annua]|uniref:Carbohydrate-binding-like fold n=1 Tax=Artemisia annua TaxID=35608 RepID=A0A2U1KIF9_ARTAN|nr:Carbohydrate-binding-like fold [Artemisia annua]